MKKKRKRKGRSGEIKRNSERKKEITKEQE
jgi:hypothetical protein